MKSLQSGLVVGIGALVIASACGSPALFAAKAGRLDSASQSFSQSPPPTSSSAVQAAYAAIRVDGLSPDRGTAAGGTPIAIFGTGLARVSSITVDHTDVTCSPLPTSISALASPETVFASYERSVYDASQHAGGLARSSLIPPRLSTNGACLAAGDRLFVLTPLHAPGSVPVSVLGNHLSFTYVAAAAPEVDAVTPNTGSAAGGGGVSLLGSGFTGASGVTFGLVPVGGFGAVIVWNDSFISITLDPPGTANTTVDVQVTTPAGASAINLADRFTYTTQPVPIITAIDPRSGPIGTPITISGSGFLGATQATVGGISVALSCAGACGDSAVGLAAPAGVGGTVDITVTTPIGTSATSAADLFTYVASVPPAITTFGPVSGSTSGGTSVYINGSGFLGTSSVSFGANSATSFTAQAGFMVATSPPAGSGSVHIRVTTPGGSVTSAATFTYTSSPPSTPEVDGLSVHSGNAQGGTSVTIYGRGLTGFTSVQFGSALAPTLCIFFTCNDESILVSPSYAPAPAGLTVDVTVTTPAGTSPTNATDRFTYVTLAPVVAQIVPDHGFARAPTDVTIYGSGLVGVTAVHLGTTPATYFPTLYDNQVSALSPPGSGTVDITVTTSAGNSATSAADLYTYVPEPPPAVTALGPNSGPVAGGTTVYITGAGFGGVTGVNFGSTPAASFQLTGDGLIKTTSPPGTGQVAVRVTTPAGTSPPVPAALFGYLSAPDAPPAVSAMAGAVGTGTAIVSWSPPVWDGGSPITSYTVRCAPACTPVVVAGSIHTATISGLDGYYTFTVTATNVYGTGPPSSATTSIGIRGPGSQSSPPAIRSRGPVTQSSPAPAPTPR